MAAGRSPESRDEGRPPAREPAPDESRLARRLRRALAREEARRRAARSAGVPAAGEGPASPARRAASRETDARPDRESPPDAESAAAPVRAPPALDAGLLVWRERIDPSGGAREPGTPPLPGGSPAAEALAGRLADRGIDPAGLVFIDIETCGLGDLPIFLVGAMRRAEGAWEIVQFLAPDPAHEPALLRRTAALLWGRPAWVSFNGRSFDLPRLERRARRHGIDWPPARSHRDLLLDVRRQWGGQLPDCRLATVERRLLGLERLPGDVPGREVPDRYWDFVRTGERRWLDPVIEHNRRDVAALAVLLERLAVEGMARGGGSGSGGD